MIGGIGLVIALGFQPTYEELKQSLEAEIRRLQARFQPTYEELKRELVFLFQRSGL